MMQDSILELPKQFEFGPVIVNAGKLKKFRKFLVCGMGGSHLAGDLVKLLESKSNIVIHSDYGLREVPDLKDRLVIVSSYSGNTEEEIDNFNEARKRKLQVVAVASGGQLIRLATRFRIPFVQLPNGEQPRMAIGYSLLGILKLMGQDSSLKRIQSEGVKLQPARFEGSGKGLAKRLAGRVPIIYSSIHNKALAYYWKITLNETGKVPAFYNVFPELNHNEMQGYEKEKLSGMFSFLFLDDKSDPPRIQKRMKIMKKLFARRHLPVEMIKLDGTTLFQKIFNLIFLATWAAYYLALQRHLNPEQVPLIEEFKERISL